MLLVSIPKNNFQNQCYGAFSLLPFSWVLCELSRGGTGDLCLPTFRQNWAPSFVIIVPCSYIISPWAVIFHRGQSSSPLWTESSLRSGVLFGSSLGLLLRILSQCLLYHWSHFNSVVTRALPQRHGCDSLRPLRLSSSDSVHKYLLYGVQGSVENRKLFHRLCRGKAWL